MARPVAWLVLFALYAASAERAAAETCPMTGEPVPEVRTLMASKTNPATEAWIVSPDCSVQTFGLKTLEGTPGALVANLGGLDQPGEFGRTPIDHVISVPTETTSVSLVGSTVKQGADFSMATKALSIKISDVPSDIRKLLLPSSLQTLDFEYWWTEIASLDGIKLPSTLINFELGFSKVTSLKGVQFPPTLESIYIEGGPLKTIDFQLPSSLKHLVFFGMTAVSFGDLDRLVLPSGLETFKLSDSLPATIRGIRWPSTLKKLFLLDTIATEFEIRRSDVALFDKLIQSGNFSATIKLAGCSNSATLETVAGVNFCVLSDATFDALYPLPPTPVPTAASGTRPAPSPPSTRPNPGSLGEPDVDDSNSDSLLEETADETSREQATRRPSLSQGEQGDTSSPEEFGEEASPSDDASFDELGGLSPKSRNNSSTGTTRDSANGSSSSSSSTRSPQNSPIANETSGDSSRTSLTIIILACALSCAVGGIVYRVFVRSKLRNGQGPKLVDDCTSDNYARADTPTSSFETPPSIEPTAAATAVTPELEALRVAFMTDQDLVSSRIDQVQTGPAIAEGGSGVVYLGSYQGQTVAVKQLPPESWVNNKLVAKFLDEIRLCTRLDHPKIVTFIGVTWSGGRDLAAVSEFMAGGDLKTVLQKHPSSTGNEWAAPWTPNQLRSKTLIALDVIEAVVYLHSYNPPIIHRDLKAKNVLLDTKGNAKLSDFGISREMSIDQTMTSDVGTAAWIAPEVLRGERYSEKADIYSLGVLLVELDRCTHPYANEPKLMMDSAAGGDGGIQASTGMVAHKNTQIAILVSTGQLRPSSSAQCPEDVTQLAARCLNYEANERPTAMEAFYQLRQIRKALQS